MKHFAHVNVCRLIKCKCGYESLDIPWNKIRLGSIQKPLDSLGQKSSQNATPEYTFKIENVPAFENHFYLKKGELRHQKIKIS